MTGSHGRPTNSPTRKEAAPVGRESAWRPSWRLNGDGRPLHRTRAGGRGGAVDSTALSAARRRPRTGSRPGRSLGRLPTAEEGRPTRPPLWPRTGGRGRATGGGERRGWPASGDDAGEATPATVLTSCVMGSACGGIRCGDRTRARLFEELLKKLELKLGDEVEHELRVVALAKGNV
ncbi:hypothetical protein KSP39_PZI016562 [Platanthera zijinensis]|uniref:Uncharacterized protein n=1 Tax=Platanthera zijinensis TaxID=2320716 RepID=A0AAP0G0T5_9ASPA